MTQIALHYYWYNEIKVYVLKITMHRLEDAIVLTHHIHARSHAGLQLSLGCGLVTLHYCSAYFVHASYHEHESKDCAMKV